MNRYEPTNRRPVFAIAAVAMTVVTIAASVVVPASLSPLGHGDTTLAKRAAHVTEVAIDPTLIDVTGVRATKLAAAPAANTAALDSCRG